MNRVKKMAKNAYVGVDNKAKKIKNIYVGVETQVPVYGKKQITFSSENINEFFTVQNNSAYPFEINPSTTNQVGFAPGNIGVNSSTSQIILTANQEIVLKKIYAQYYTEQKFDKLNITVKGEVILSNASGIDIYDQTVNKTLNVGDNIVMSYVKDSTTHHNQETMTNIILTCNPITIKTITGYETKPVARRIKKAYVGVNGKARLCYSGDEGYSKLKKIAQYKLDEYPNDITYVPGEDSCYVSTNNGNVYKFNNNAQIVWQKSVYDEIGYIYSIRPFDKNGGQIMVSGVKKATSLNYDGSTYGYVYEFSSSANGAFISNQRGEAVKTNFALYNQKESGKYSYTYRWTNNFSTRPISGNSYLNINEIKCFGSYYVDRALSPDNAVRHLVSYVDFNGDRAFDVFYAGGSIGNELDPSTQTTKPITAIGSFGKSGIKLLLGYSDGTLECYDTSTILYSLVWSDRISDQGAVASISVGERITIVSYTYGKIRIYDTSTMNEIENDGDYVKRITAVSQGDTNDHIVYVINGTRGSGETSNSLCVFEYQD
jgi:hypothetical protein